MTSSRVAGVYRCSRACSRPCRQRPAARARVVVRRVWSSLRLPNATVTSATEVAAGAFTPPTAPGRGVAPALAKTMAALQPFCRVADHEQADRGFRHQD